jgi:spermidine/putrescine transport system substrate-binding protein
MQKPPKIYVNLPEDMSLRGRQALWAQVKMGGPGETATLILVFVGFFLLYVFIIVSKKIKRRREVQPRR